MGSSSDTDLQVNIIADSSGVSQGIAQTKQALQQLGQSAGAAGQSMAAGMAVGSGSIRELIVLSHELLVGNFNRIPGSMMVLAERSGNLHGIVDGLAAAFTPMNIAIGATIVALGSWALHEIHVKDAINDVEIAMQASGTQGVLSSEQIQQYIAQLSKLPGVSRDDAVEAMRTLAQSMDMSHDKIDRVIGDLRMFSKGLGTDVPGAAKVMNEILQDPSQAFLSLSKSIHFTKDQLDAFYAALNSGDKSKESAVLISALEKNFDGLQNKITSVTEGAEKLYQDLKELSSGSIMGFGTGGDDQQDNQNKSMQSGEELQQNILAARVKDNELIGQGYQALEKSKDKESEVYRISQQITAEKVEQAAAMRQGDSVLSSMLTKNIQSLEIEKQRAANSDSKAAQQQAVQAYKESMNEELNDTNLSYKDREQIVEKFVAYLKATYPKDSSDLKSAMQQDVQLHKDAMDEQLQDLNLNFMQRRQIIQNYENWVKQTYPADVQAFASAQKEMATQQKQEVASMDSSWNNYFNTFNSGLEKMIGHHESFRQFIAQQEVSMIMSFLKNIEMGVAHWIDGNIIKLTSTNATNAAVTASNTGAAAAGVAAQKTADLSSILKSASTAAAGAYASTSAIPIVGPALAPEAAALAFAKTAAFAVFDVGTPYVPNTGIAMVHQGEAIIPASMNKNGLGGMGGGDTHFHVSAIDAQSVQQFFQTHKSALAKTVVDAYRQGNSSYRYPRS